MLILCKVEMILVPPLEITDMDEVRQRTEVLRAGSAQEVLSKPRCSCCYLAALTAPLTEEMLSGYLLMLGALQVLGTDRKKCLP